MVTFKLERDNDWSLDDGKLIRAEGSEILNQNIIKLQSTDKENSLNRNTIPYRYNPEYGTNLNFTRVLSNINSIEDAIQTVKDEVTNSLVYYSRIQKEKQELGLPLEATMVDAEVFAYSERIREEGRDMVVIKYEQTIVSGDGNRSEFTGEVERLG